MSSHAHGSPWWSAEKDFALLMLLTGGNRKAAQRLWLRKVRIHREAPPDAGASAPKAATAKPQPAPARAQAVPTSWRRPPSSRGASAARSGCARSTSRARSGPAFALLAGCWHGGPERRLFATAMTARAAPASAALARSTDSSGIVLISDREQPPWRLPGYLSWLWGGGLSWSAGC